MVIFFISHRGGLKAQLALVKPASSLLDDFVPLIIQGRSFLREPVSALHVKLGAPSGYGPQRVTCSSDWPRALLLVDIDGALEGRALHDSSRFYLYFWRFEHDLAFTSIGKDILDVVLFIEIDGLEVECLLVMVLDDSVPQFTCLEHGLEI